MATDVLKIENVPIATLRPDPANARQHPVRNLEAIAASLQRFGQQKPIVVARDGTVIAGNGTLGAARRLGWETIAAVRTSLTGAAARAFALMDNRTTDLSGWDTSALLEQLGELSPELQAMLDFTPDEIALLESPIEPGDGQQADAEDRTGSLSESFGVPPFTVLDARQGWWQRRKQAWLGLGIESELGRGRNCLDFSETAAAFGFSRNQPALAFKGQQSLNAIARRSRTTVIPGGGAGSHSARLGSDSRPVCETGLSGTSIFCPVLAELLVRWFTPAAGTVLDPFSGGSARGVVASRLGRHYVGVDLRQEQIVANRQQAATICRGGVMPKWVVGDALNIGGLAEGVQADLVFTCPPYGSLERYSDDPRDLSTMAYPAFIQALAKILAATVSMLKPDRFAVLVVGEVRDPATGLYQGFVPDTVRLMEAAGVRFYGEAILITVCGSLPLRTRKQFEVSRKLGKTHQNVLVFVKGDPRAATEACGECQFGSLETQPLPGGPGGEDDGALTEDNP